MKGFKIESDSKAFKLVPDQGDPVICALRTSESWTLEMLVGYPASMQMPCLISTVLLNLVVVPCAGASSYLETLAAFIDICTENADDPFEYFGRVAMRDNVHDLMVFPASELFESADMQDMVRPRGLSVLYPDRIMGEPI